MLSVPTGCAEVVQTDEAGSVQTRIRLKLGPAMPYQLPRKRARSGPDEEAGPSKRHCEKGALATRATGGDPVEGLQPDVSRPRKRAKDSKKSSRQEARVAKFEAVKAVMLSAKQPAKDLDHEGDVREEVHVDLQPGMTMLQGVRELVMAQKLHEQVRAEESTKCSSRHDRPTTSDLFEPMHRVIYDVKPKEQVQTKETPSSAPQPLPLTRLDVMLRTPPPYVPEKMVRNVVHLLHLICAVLSEEQKVHLLSEPLTRKLQSQLQDPLALCSGALPDWCEALVCYEPHLFGYSARHLFFSSKAMGISRTVARLQQDDNHRRLPRFGQLVTERVIVPRNELKFMAAARRAFTLYARRRSILDFAFEGEEGTGVGPTAEFFTLVSMGIQSNAAMWIPDSSTGKAGLFPCLLPTDKNKIESTLDQFQFLGQVLHVFIWPLFLTGTCPLLDSPTTVFICVPTAALGIFS